MDGISPNQSLLVLRPPLYLPSNAFRDPLPSPPIKKKKGGGGRDDNFTPEL